MFNAFNGAEAQDRKSIRDLFQSVNIVKKDCMDRPKVRADGAPWRQCAERDGAALDQARRTKERTYPELTGEQGRARLVVLVCETGGRWSEEAQSFLRHLARARAHSEPREMRLAARRVWLRRWCTALACCAAQAFASSLLERRGGLGADGEIPSTSDVIWGDRHGG